MEPNDKEITASIGIFSGRENPKLLLEGELSEQFAERIKSTVGKEAIHAPPPPRLGFYYGFQIHVPAEQAKRLELSKEYNVYHGVITVIESSKQDNWRDTGNIEQFLLEQAMKQGHGDLLEKVGMVQQKMEG